MSQCARELDKGRRDGVRRSQLFSLIIVFALFVASCTPSSPVQNQVTPSPEIPEENNTSTVTPTEDASIDITLYRGNSQRTGVFDFPAIRSQPSVKWQTKVNSTWLMPPILADGMLYTGSGDGVIYALDAETGKEIWSTGGFSQLENSGAVAGDILVVGGYDQRVHALDRQTGDVLWSFETSSKSVSEPTISDGVVYVSDSSHEFPRGPRHLYALDAQTGQELWRFEVVSTFLPAPALSEDTIYVTTTGEVFALHRK